MEAKIIDLIFQKVGEPLTAIRISNKNLSFALLQGPTVRFGDIEGLKFSEAGIIKEFPDLIDLPFEQMRKEAIKRFKEKINKMENDDEIAIYIEEDLKKHGYILKMVKKPGFRPWPADKWRQKWEGMK